MKKKEKKYILKNIKKIKSINDKMFWFMLNTDIDSKFKKSNTKIDRRVTNIYNILDEEIYSYDRIAKLVDGA